MEAEDRTCPTCAGYLRPRWDCPTCLGKGAPQAAAPPEPLTCDACAGPVRVHSADEGTCTYEPRQAPLPGQPICPTCGGLDREKRIRAFLSGTHGAEDLRFLVGRLDRERAARQTAEADRTALLRAASTVLNNTDDCGVTSSQRERALLELAEVRLRVLRAGQEGWEDDA